MAVSDIGLARKQRVFAILEDVVGTMKFPVASSIIRPAGNAVINQNPEFSDSEELQDTLDTLDRFQNAMPAGEWTIPMYVRPLGSFATLTAPQGDALFTSLQGLKYNASTHASLASNLTAGKATVRYRKLHDGTLPSKGVMLCGTEYMFYETLTATNSTQGVLTVVTRGYSGAAATHATGVEISLRSVYYKQASTSPSVSIWIETDHFVQGLSGATVGSLKLSVTNEGAVKAEFSGKGMQMVWAGSSSMVSTKTTTATQIHVLDAKIFSAGSRIYNYSTNVTNGGIGWTVVASNATTGVLRLSAAIGSTWSTNNVIRGFLPGATVLGEPIESRNTAIKINNIAATFKSGELTINSPKNYLTDEVGTTYPQSYLEDKREITSSMGIYFRKADARYFAEGYSSGNEVPVQLTFGNVAAHKFMVYMKKCKLEVPKVEMAVPAVELTIPLKALGTLGEDSCELSFI